ncbi:GNAT superfamily N-acetyltransferase [Actinoplanes lutulentus]|nr:GNAT family N-acetyltransferase [Actinoplanes lutulentus]MBB2948992.1 GNAT superfamily N-acetyltransferase [Actinoplanes lutulentus]
MALTAAEGTPVPVFGAWESAGEVRAVFHRFPGGGLSVTPLTPAQADSLAAFLVSAGWSLPSAGGDRATAVAFAEAWQRHTGATPVLRVRLHLHRLGVLTPPSPFPVGRGRVAGERDHSLVMGWCRDFAADVGEAVVVDADTWAGTRFAEKRYTFWETPEGVPVSMAGVNPMVGGQVRVDPVYTPAHLRGFGYAAAVTAEVSRAALAAGATDVVLFTNAANRTSNALYRRIGFVPIADWAVYDFMAGHG